MDVAHASTPEVNCFNCSNDCDVTSKHYRYFRNVVVFVAHVLKLRRVRGSTFYYATFKSHVGSYQSAV
jgi:hypothetical protein